MKGAISALFGIFAATLLILMVPAATLAEGPQAYNSPPPVGQALMREGTLATELAAALNPDFVKGDEAAAESWLGEKGISPANGWIADYPVTPVIMGELQAALGAAADSQRIPFTRDEALKRLAAISDLAIASQPPGDSGTETVLAGDELVDPGAVYNYYTTEGPPVVTYYAPPPDYTYLYSWVPYPFWWGGFSFGGFFILNDFHRSVFHDRFHHHGHHDGNHHREFVSNHYRDRATNRFSRVDPGAGVRTAVPVRFSGNRDGFGRNRAIGSGVPGTSFRSGMGGRTQNAPSAFRSGAINTATFQGNRGRSEGAFFNRQSGGTNAPASFSSNRTGSMPVRSFSPVTRSPASVVNFSSQGRSFGSGSGFNSGRSFSSPARSFSGSTPSFSSFRSSGGGASFSRSSSGSIGGGFSRGGGGFSGGHGGGGFSGGRGGGGGRR